MINKIIKLSFVFLLFIGLLGCDSTDDNTSFLDDRTSVSFFAPSGLATLLVNETGVSSYDVIVGISEPKPVDRAFVFSIDPSSTAVEGVDFTMSSSMIIPANSVVGKITVTADYGASTLEGKSLIFNLDSVEDAALGTTNRFKLNIIRFCPVNAEFLGEYTLSIVANGIFDTPTFTPGSVMVYQGDEENDRFLVSRPYPAFGVFSEMEFYFSLVCGNVEVPGGQPTFVGCGSSTTLGPLDTLGTYDPDDDSVFEIHFADDEGGASCGAQADAIIRLTKV
jgi:hypothetical protein